MDLHVSICTSCRHVCVISILRDPLFKGQHIFYMLKLHLYPEMIRHPVLGSPPR